MMSMDILDEHIDMKDDEPWMRRNNSCLVFVCVMKSICLYSVVFKAHRKYFSAVLDYNQFC